MDAIAKRLVEAVMVHAEEHRGIIASVLGERLSEILAHVEVERRSVEIKRLSEPWPAPPIANRDPFPLEGYMQLVSARTKQAYIQEQLDRVASRER